MWYAVFVSLQSERGLLFDTIHALYRQCCGANSQQLLAEKQLPFDLLRPLILETAEKVQDHLPADVQTGPAVRNDEKTMASHLEQLQENPDLQAIYKLLSQGIIKMDNRG